MTVIGGADHDFGRVHDGLEAMSNSEHSAVLEIFTDCMLNYLIRSMHQNHHEVSNYEILDKMIVKRQNLPNIYISRGFIQNQNPIIL